MAKAAEEFRGFALSLAGSEEHVACKGTAIEQSSFKVKKKSFFFLQEKDDVLILRFKLADSLGEAEADESGEVEVGKGWVTWRYPLNRSSGKRRLKKWVRESHALSK